MLIIPSPWLVFLEHREVDAVDFNELVQRKTQRLGNENIDFNKCEAASKVGYVLLAVHAAAALYHHHFMRDDTVRRMMPGGRENNS